MSKKEKILILLVIIIFFLLIYFAMLPKSVKITNLTKEGKSVLVQEDEKSFVDLSLLEENYKKALRQQFKTIENEIVNYQGAASSSAEISDPIDIKSIEMKEKISDIKGRVIAMTVPEDMRGLHVKTVLAIDRFDDFVINGDINDRITSLEMLTEAKNKYSWLLDNN